MAPDDREYVYSVEHVLTGEMKDVQVGRMRFYSDKVEIVKKKLQDHFKLLMKDKAEYLIDQITGVKSGKGSTRKIARGNWFIESWLIF